MDFKNNKLFMDAIKENDIFSIKSDLEGYIVKYKGDKRKCDEVVEYAIKNSSFNWESDDGIFLGDKKTTISEEYFYEKERLVQNFTKERYLRVINLYNEYTQGKEDRKEEIKKASTNSQTKAETRKNLTSSKKKQNMRMDQEEKTVMIRTGILIVAVIVLIYLLLKIIF